MHGKLLDSLVAARGDDFTRCVAECGAGPDRKSASFAVREARVTLQTALPRAGQEGAIDAGLDALAAERIGRAWRRDDGSEVRSERCLIDANRDQASDVVSQFCRQTSASGILMPGHGRVGRGVRRGARWRSSAGS
ncbi:MAG TPA: hypothetical protein PKC43_04000 [Phycisphaerales bacterium]|nr:hypothetical protein [Phycisphaerales bacterium]HMP36589.1 hypothetical protein [Phycisphaerales bacterium]